MKKHTILRMAVVPFLLAVGACGPSGSGDPAVVPSASAATADTVKPEEAAVSSEKPAETNASAAEAESKPAETVTNEVSAVDAAAFEREKALVEAKARGEAAAKYEAEAKAKALEEEKKAAEEEKKAAAEKEKKDAEERAAAEKAALEKAAAEAKKEEEAAKAAREAQEKKDAADKAERQETGKMISTRVFKLYHVSAKEVAEKFNSTWSGEFGEKWKVTKMAQAFEESNSVMVTAPNRILEACAEVVSRVDTEAKQVYIEARFVELGNTASHKVGIDWAMLNGIQLTANGGVGLQKTVVGEAVSEYSRTITSKSDGTTTYKVSGTQNKGSVLSSDNEDGKISYFSGTLNVSEMSLMLKALDASGDTKTFSNPKIIVSSGKMATVDMTTKYPNVKISAKRTTGTSDSVDIAANMEAIPGEDKFMFAKEAFFSWGISLEVTPRIGTNGLINVAIVPTISSLDSWVETGTGSADENGTISSKYPVINVQRLISEFNLESGTTAVIGGLSITEEEQQDSGIPVLRNIPWVGTRLFGSMERVKVQKEIIVFVTVGLVNPRAVDAAAGLPKNAVLGRQYTKAQKLEPGDRPEHNMEGFDSLDMRTLEEQAKDPLQKQTGNGFDLRDYMSIPFTKDPDYKK